MIQTHNINKPEVVEITLAYLHSPVTVNGLGLDTVTTLDAGNCTSKGILVSRDEHGIMLSKGALRAIIPLTNVKVYVLK